MEKQFVDSRDGSFYIAGSRVPLAHVVRQFLLGESPEAIRSNYPTLSLEQVYGAITFYLGNREMVERDMLEREMEEESFAGAELLDVAELKRRLDRIRQPA